MPRMVDGSAARGAHVPVCLICRMFGAFSGVGSGGGSPRSSVNVGFSQIGGDTLCGWGRPGRVCGALVR